MPRSRRTVSAVLAGLALLAAGCGGDSPQEPRPATIELPARTWVLSSNITTLDGRATDEEVRDMVQENNRIWAQAGVRWAVESIRRDSVTKEGEEGNLMALPFCDVGTTRLSEDQIRRARRQVERGVPVTSLDSIVAIRDVLGRR